jgi:hypothetical protein
VYNAKRLEWHLDVEVNLNPAGYCVVLSYSMTSLLIDLNRLVVVLAKNQDHRASCGVFVFGLPNAVRRWLGLRYPVTRANQSGESGLGIELGGNGKSLALCASKPFKSVRCDAMTWLRKASYRSRAKLHFYEVRLCFAQTITKRQLRG